MSNIEERYHRTDDQVYFYDKLRGRREGTLQDKKRLRKHINQMARWS